MEWHTNNFVLHFPNQHRTNASSPKVGEIILIYQNINGQKIFSHLVTPVDSVEVDDDTRQEYRYGRNVQIVATTSLKHLIPVNSTRWNKVNFQGIGQGNACKIENMSGIGEYDVLLQDVWDKFSPFFIEDYKSSLQITTTLSSEIDQEDLAISVEEGRLRLIKHFARERNSDIIVQKKRKALAEGKFRCEVCDFSFPDTYQVDFIECHHLTPLSQSGFTKTTLDDLALVCPNCHRMLHKSIDGKFLSLEQLSDRIKKNSDRLRN